MPTFLVERYGSPTSVSAARAAVAGLAPAVTVLEVIVMEADDACFWVIEGASAAAVADAFAAADIRIDRIGRALYSRS